MDGDEDWSKILQGHPIFSAPKNFGGSSSLSLSSLELSANTLPSFTRDPVNEEPYLTGRRQVMALKESNLILAIGKNVRVTCLSDAKLGRSAQKTYKTLHTPNIEFEIHQIALNPSGKLLAVAGLFQVALVVMPRAGFAKLVPDTIDCKSVQVGQFYHATTNSTPVAKIDWHPWGDAGSTLLVMTVDGKLREYDISVDTEEPQQVLSFVQERKAGKFVAEDDSEREVTSFVLGKGRADWGPLTIYAIMKSGDLYSICPYMPQNASIPSSFVHSLECFISAKQEFLAHELSSKNLTTVYDYQQKYVAALIKQLPPGTVFPAVSRSVLMHPPTTIKAIPMRQGPFLLQPSPRILEGSEGGDATDIVYLAFDADFEDEVDSGGETEHLGVIMIAYQDGKIDVCLDVEKIEARWTTKQNADNELPMLAVYESIDLGIVTMLNLGLSSSNGNSLLNLLQGNHIVFVTDPINDDALYVYHAFGAHALHIGQLLQSLAFALRADDSEAETSLKTALQKSASTVVQPLLFTFSVERKCSNPVIAVTIPNDVYLTYSIFVLTSTMRITAFPLTFRTDPPRNRPRLLTMTDEGNAQNDKSRWLTSVEGPLTYVSLLGTEPYEPPEILSQYSGLPSNPRLSLPPAHPDGSTDLILTPETLRYIATIIAQISSQMHEIQLVFRAAEIRAMLQKQEFVRLSSKCKELENVVETLKGRGRANIETRLYRVQEEQKSLLARLGRILQVLMEKASPELSEHETKWFDELKRIKEEINGVGKYDEDSLVARTRQLEREYGRLLPSFKGVIEKEKQRKDQSTQNRNKLGFSQAFELGKRSNLEHTKITQVEREISLLASKLELTLGRLPNGQ